MCALRSVSFLFFDTPPFPHMSHPVSPICQKLILFFRVWRLLLFPPDALLPHMSHLILYICICHTPLVLHISGICFERCFSCSTHSFDRYLTPHVSYARIVLQGPPMPPPIIPILNDGQRGGSAPP